jgi:hypothetical protein
MKVSPHPERWPISVLVGKHEMTQRSSAPSTVLHASKNRTGYGVLEKNLTLNRQYIHIHRAFRSGWRC